MATLTLATDGRVSRYAVHGEFADGRLVTVRLTTETGATAPLSDVASEHGTTVSMVRARAASALVAAVTHTCYNGCRRAVANRGDECLVCLAYRARMGSMAVAR